LKLKEYEGFVVAREVSVLKRVFNIAEE